MARYTDADRPLYEALRLHYLKGATKIRYSTGPGQMQEVEYRSLADMRALLEEMESALDPAAAAPSAITLIRYVRPR
ncbi:hypothetical protein NON00_13120 [Roseomonas sp. GC11]|uniref:phage head-tail joining protein n=1 Tax=Roseomonas sp. GC11 TaxID=2950546 RepID=UPI00210D44D7|nr:hypothetical protein [Roseomonas sp. GC11]MCQ4160869.1 hypothetical protein [Roseomonas sp. GC11]